MRAVVGGAQKVWRRPAWARGSATALGGGVDEDKLIDADSQYTPMGEGGWPQLL